MHCSCATLMFILLSASGHLLPTHSLLLLTSDDDSDSPKAKRSEFITSTGAQPPTEVYRSSCPFLFSISLTSCSVYPSASPQTEVGAPANSPGKGVGATGGCDGDYLTHGVFIEVRLFTCLSMSKNNRDLVHRGREQAQSRGSGTLANASVSEITGGRTMGDEGWGIGDWGRQGLFCLPGQQRV